MRMRTRLSLAALVTVTAAAWAAPALAHVTIDPGRAEKGGFAELVFRVPNEREGVHTTAVAVYFPADHPIASVSVRPTPGWHVEVDRTRLATPIRSDDGEVTEAVSRITWTGDLGPGEYEDFAVSVGPLPDDTDRLVFKTLQTYGNGDVVRWIELPSAGEEPERPAPVLTLTAPDEATAPSRTVSAAAAGAPAAEGGSGGTSDGTARALGIAGLVLGAAALAVAVARSRRRPS